MRNSKPILGITMGDAAGVGPEIIAMVLADEKIHALCHPVVIGDAAVMREALKITHLPDKIKGIKEIAEAQFAQGVIEVLDLNNIDLKALVRGEVNSMTGKAAFEYIQQAVELALAKDIEAIVTAPLNKEALNRAGYHYPGHTEILAELCQVKEVSMMLVMGNLRVAHLSTHLPLREACDLVTKERIVKVVKLTHKALKQMGMEEPKIAIAGLNPHAGEKGLFGQEEITQIIPAVKEVCSQGIKAVGPIPPDTVFYQAGQGQFDAVIAMYHDQGHIPLKTLGFFEGVNLTLGLPIVRTSVDHGTAFDKAGKGTANPKSLIKAIQLAARIVKK